MDAKLGASAADACHSTDTGLWRIWLFASEPSQSCWCVLLFTGSTPSSSTQGGGVLRSCRHLLWLSTWEISDSFSRIRGRCSPSWLTCQCTVFPGQVFWDGDPQVLGWCFWLEDMPFKLVLAIAWSWCSWSCDGEDVALLRTELHFPSLLPLR